MTQTEEIRLAALAKPGSNAMELLATCKGVEDIGSAATYLKILCGKGALSRARIGGRFRYWPPGQAPADEEFKQGAVAPVRLERVGKPPTQSKEPEGVAVAGPGGAMVKGAQRHARKPDTPTAKLSSVITPDWLVTKLRDGVLVIRKDTDQGFFLNGEAVAAIITIGAT